MKPERKQELRAACEAATKEPWFAWMSPSDVHEVNTGLAGNPVICKVGKSTQAEANADFIALARSALPEAMAEIERLQAELTDMTAERDSETRWAKHYHDKWIEARDAHEQIYKGLIGTFTPMNRFDVSEISRKIVEAQDAK